VAPSPRTLVVVNCAGRTRSIIGAQSLINAGVPNRVVALRNGTMGWELAGFQVERGAGRRAPEVSEAALAYARKAAAQVAARFGVKTIDRAMLERFHREADRRTLYLFDVRHPEEYEANHLPGALSAPGGQLVQATDRYVGVLRARIVLVDDTGVRATMTASWLRQMGWDEVFVLGGGLDGAREAGPEPVQRPAPPVSVSANTTLGPVEREAAMRDYLSWELGLVEAVQRDGTLRFPDFGA
jgi:rhodanese-related sulfurtransferase